MSNHFKGNIMKFNLFLSRLLTVFITLVSFNSLSSDTVIAGILIDGLHQKNGNGDYDKIVKSAGNLKVLTPAAAEKLFIKGQAECISPANADTNFYTYDFPVITSNSMFQAKIYAYTPMGSPEIVNLSDLAGKKVGIRSGMPYGNKIDNAELKFIKARDIETNIKRLKQGKIDAFIAYWPDSDSAFDKVGISPLPHAKASPLAVHDDQVVCRDTAAGKAVIKAVNASI